MTASTTETEELRKALERISPGGLGADLIEAMTKTLPHSYVDVRTFVSVDAPTKPYVKIAMNVHQDDLAAFLDILLLGIVKDKEDES